MSETMKAARYIFFTNNVDGMVAFYRDILKMRVMNPPKAMENSAGWVQLKSGGVEVAIHRAGKPGSAGLNRNKLVFIVSDVAAAREELLGQGVRMGKHYVQSEFECCDFKDSDGNVLQISSR